MTQVLSTFNRLEQSRFQAFRRSTFRGDAISDHVAHCLAANGERAYARNCKMIQYLGDSSQGAPQQHCPYVKNTNDSNSTSSSGSTTAASLSTKKKRSLQDMVPPGQADEITVVVSTLAKAYAQRLVTAARRVATAEGVGEETPLSPEQVLKAYHSRVNAGLDPGFFLRKPKATTVAESSAAIAAALGTVDMNALQRNAALAAQEEYDKYVKEKKESAMDVDETSPTKDRKEEEKAVGEKDVLMKEKDETANAIDA